LPVTYARRSFSQNCLPETFPGDRKIINDVHIKFSTLDFNNYPPSKTLDKYRDILNNADVLYYCDEYASEISDHPKQLYAHSLLSKALIGTSRDIPIEDAIELVQTLAASNSFNLLVDAMSTDQKSSVLNSLAVLARRIPDEQKLAFFHATESNELIDRLLETGKAADVSCFLFNVFDGINPGIVDLTLRESSALNNIKWDKQLEKHIRSPDRKVCSETSLIFEILCRPDWDECHVYNAGKLENG